MARLEDEFRRRGFASPSVSELAKAAGVNRPTLAASFGDRAQLYRSAADRFADRMREAMELAFASGTVRDGLERYLGLVIEIYVPEDGQPKGCLVFSTAPASADDPVVEEVLRDALADLDSALARELDRAASNGPPLSVSQRSAAYLTAAAIHSMAIRARGGAGRRELGQISNALLESLFEARSS